MSTETVKTVLITGASSGIGAASVDCLTAEGWRVFAGMHDPADTKGGGAGAVTPIALDVTDEDSIDAAVAEIERQAGGLDALVNNAGIPGAGPVETIPNKIFRDVIETNLIGQFAVTKAFLPMLRASEAESSSSARSAAGSPSLTPRPTTPPSSVSRASPSRCAPRCCRSASMSP